MDTKEAPMEKHIPTTEEIEAIRIYNALLLDGWRPTEGNRWINDPNKEGYFLIRMCREDQIDEIRSPMALPITNIPES